jgi:outer membrane protein insertion porin family
MSGFFQEYQNLSRLTGLLCGLAFLLASCNTAKYLGPDESFLDKNRIEFKTTEQIKKKGNLKSELSTLYKQEPNGRFFFIPREWFYYNVQDTLGRSNFVRGYRRWMMRQFGEEPVIYKAQEAEATERSMEYFLQHKGYFLANVQSFSEYSDRKQKKVTITYEIHPNRQYLIDTVAFISRDTQVQRHLRDIRKNTLLRRGSPLDASLYDQESARIVNYLRNQGYAYFNQNYLASLEADSAEFGVRLTMEALLPPNDSLHRTYTVGDIYFYPNYSPSGPPPDNIDTVAAGIYFIGSNSDFKIRERTLLNTLYLKKGELFRQDNYDRTNRQLNNLGLFRFVTLKAEPDPDVHGRLNFRIYLTPNARFSYGTDLEVNTSNSPFIGRRLLGVSGNVSFRHRNFFRGAELFITSFEGGLDLNLSKLNQVDSLINTVDLRYQSDLYFPKFIDFFGAYRLLDKLKLVRHPFYVALRDRGATRLSVGYNYLERINLFSLNSLNVGFGYDFRPSSRHRYIINHFGIDYLSPRTTGLFDSLVLSQNENLRLSFDKQLFTSFLFRDFHYTFTGLQNRLGESHSFITRLELSGLEVFLANKLYNSLAAPEKRDTFALDIEGSEIEFSQYARVEFDYRHYRRFSKNQFLVLRAAIGYAAPFGFSTSVPYVKQLSAGGPQSVRAWHAREIGPGGYLDPLTQAPGVNPTLFYQTGNFKLDFNVEYRFPFFTFFGIKYEGALFLDAGNVWNTYSDPGRPFSQLRWTPLYDADNKKIADNLFKYIAVGTGFGLRLDFSYFIFRLDLGMKLRNPHPQTDAQGNVLEQFWRSPFENGLRDLNLNLGLGYPF